MKSKLYVLMGLMAFMFMLPSCKNSQDVEETILTVSEKALTFDKSAGEKSINVETNRESWTYMQSGDWFTVSQEAKSLKISVPANEKGVTRKGSVLVMAGDMAVRVDVTQSAADVVLSTIPTELNFGPGASSVRVELIANVDDFLVSSDAPWLKVERVVGTKTFMVKVDKNDALRKRPGKILLTVGTTKKEFLVNQEGLFLFPIFGNELTMDQITEFEEARGSKLSEAPGLFNPYYRFSTASALVPQILYDYPEGNKTYKMAAAMMTATDYKKPEVVKYITDSGFAVNTKESTEGMQIFDNEKLGVRLTVSFNKANNGPDMALLVYNIIPKQPQPYETFKKFPYFTDMKLINKGKAPEVEAWEKANGGVISKDPAMNTAAVKWYDTPKGEESIFGRLYFFKEQDKENKVPKDQLGLVEEIAGFYKEYTKAMWINGNEGVITNEFKELLAKEGFKFLQVNRGSHFYVKNDPFRPGNTLYMSIGVAKFKDINVGNYTLNIHFFSMSTKGNSVTAMDLIMMSQKERKAFCLDLTKAMNPLPFK